MQRPLDSKPHTRVPADAAELKYEMGRLKVRGLGVRVRVRARVRVGVRVDSLSKTLLIPPFL